MRSFRSLLVALVVLATATVADACLSGPSNAGSCCGPALAAQTSTCCQNPQAASVSPCCSSYAVQSAPSAPVSVGCVSGGCSSASSGSGCSGGGCANGCVGSDCSSGASGSVAGGSNAGCATGSTGSGCSENTYDASSEYQTSGEKSEHKGDNSDYYESAPEKIGEATAEHGNAAPNNKSLPSEGDDEYEEPSQEHQVGKPKEHVEKPKEPQEHIDIPEEKPDEKPEEAAEQSSEHIDSVKPKPDKVKQPEKHAEVSEEKPHQVEQPPEHVNIPERKSKKIKKPEEASPTPPVEEHTEASGYTDASPALASKTEKLHPGSVTAEEISEFNQWGPSGASHQVDEREPTHFFVGGDSGELGPAEDQAACQFLTCDFEQNALCLYQSSPDEKPKRIQLASLTAQFGRRTTIIGRRGRRLRATRFLSRKWETVSGRYHNRVTGIPKAGTGGTYAATYLRPKERAILTTDNLYYKKTKMLFQAYEATKGMEMRMCCDSLANCPWKSNIDVRPTERKWINRSGSCPKGTKRILFVCENSGKYQGACGLDNVRVNGHSCEDADPKEFFIVTNQ